MCARASMGRDHRTNHVHYLGFLILNKTDGSLALGRLVGNNRVMATKYSDDLSGQAKNSRAREAASLILRGINTARLSGS